MNTDEILAFALEMAKDASTIILEYFELADKSVEIKSDSSPVTAADKKINDLLLKRVADEFPGHGVLAEEGSANEDRRELWVCDPIDGTNGFIRRIPTGMFSLAFVVDGEPIVAVAADPFQRKIFSAVRGQSAFCNGQPVHVSSHATLDGANVGISTSYNDIHERRDFFDGLLAVGVRQTIVPGNVFKSSLVATGNIDAHIFPGKSAHDIAAMKLIVEEAGGKVVNLYGENQKYNGKIFGAIITNGQPELTNALIGRIRDFGAEDYVGY